MLPLYSFIKIPSTDYAQPNRTVYLFIYFVSKEIGKTGRQASKQGSNRTMQQKRTVIDSSNQTSVQSDSESVIYECPTQIHIGIWN